MQVVSQRWKEKIMLKEERRLRDYINGKTQQAGIYPPVVRKMVTALIRAVREDERRKTLGHNLLDETKSFVKRELAAIRRK